MASAPQAGLTSVKQSSSALMTLVLCLEHSALQAQPSRRQGQTLTISGSCGCPGLITVSPQISLVNLMQIARLLYCRQLDWAPLKCIWLTRY